MNYSFPALLHILISFMLLWQNTLTTKQLKGERDLFHLIIPDYVHHCREVKVGTSYSYLNTQSRAERKKICACSLAHLFARIQPDFSPLREFKIPGLGNSASHSELGLPTLINLRQCPLIHKSKGQLTVHNAPLKLSSQMILGVSSCNHS